VGGPGSYRSVKTLAFSLTPPTPSAPSKLRPPTARSPRPLACQGSHRDLRNPRGPADGAHISLHSTLLAGPRHYRWCLIWVSFPPIERRRQGKGKWRRDQRRRADTARAAGGRPGRVGFHPGLAVLALPGSHGPSIHFPAGRSTLYGGSLTKQCGLQENFTFYSPWLLPGDAQSVGADALRRREPVGAVVAVRGRVRPPARRQAHLASPTAVSTVVEVWNKLMSSLTPEHPYPYDAPPRTPGRRDSGSEGSKSLNGARRQQERLHARRVPRPARGRPAALCTPRSARK
jgi:hypothetical protein